MRFLISVAAVLCLAFAATAQDRKAPSVTIDDRPLKAEKKAGCVCGDDCKCAGGCPDSCPVASVGAPVMGSTLQTTSGQTIRWTGTVYVYVDEPKGGAAGFTQVCGPDGCKLVRNGSGVGSSCADGSCASGSCASGSCASAGGGSCSSGSCSGGSCSSSSARRGLFGRRR